MLPRATAIDDKKGQEVGPFMPHFYNAWMAIHDRIYQGVDLLLQALQAASVFRGRDPFGLNWLGDLKL